MTDLNHDNEFMLPVLSYFCKSSKLGVNPCMLKNMKGYED